MKTIILTATKAEIMKKVGQTTAYAGVKEPSAGEDGRFYDRLATIEEDSPLLGRFLTAAFSEVLEQLKDFTVGSAVGDVTLELRLEVSEAYDDSLTPAVEESFRSFLAASVLRRWLQLAWPVRAAEWEQEAAGHLQSMARNLYHRSRPNRRTTNHIEN